MRGKAGYSDPDPQILMTSEKGGGGGTSEEKYISGGGARRTFNWTPGARPNPPPPHPNFFGMEA